MSIEKGRNDDTLMVYCFVGEKNICIYCWSLIFVMTFFTQRVMVLNTSRIKTSVGYMYVLSKPTFQSKKEKG